MHTSTYYLIHNLLIIFISVQFILRHYEQEHHLKLPLVNSAWQIQPNPIQYLDSKYVRGVYNRSILLVLPPTCSARPSRSPSRTAPSRRAPSSSSTRTSSSSPACWTPSPSRPTTPTATGCTAAVSDLPCNVRREGGQSLVIAGSSLVMVEGREGNPL